jgi:integrase
VGVFARQRKSGKVYYAAFMWNGSLQQERVGPERRIAERVYRERKAQVAAGTYSPKRETGSVTLGTYGREWLEARRRQGTVRSVEDEVTRFRLHIEPRIGAMKLEDIRPRDVRDFVADMKADGTLKAKSIVNVFSVLTGILQSAAFEQLIPANPADVIPKGTLPAVGRTKKPPFTRDELEQLMSDERIEPDRRVLYTLMAFTGMRLGEACGRRWRNLDEVAQPLHMLTVDTQYDDRPLKTDDGEDARPRQVPVHPELADALADWKRRGFAEAYGRHPKPGDFIVPDRTTGQARTKNQAGKALYRDCDRIGIGRKGTHSFRRGFVSYARADGARKDVLERVTHNAAGEVIDGYTYFEWEPLCEAVACLRLTVKRGAEVVPLRTGLHDVLHDACPGGGANTAESLIKMVEAPGVEGVSASRNPEKTTERGLRGALRNTPVFQAHVEVAMQDMTRVMQMLSSAEKKLRKAGHHAEADVVGELARAVLPKAKSG